MDLPDSAQRADLQPPSRRAATERAPRRVAPSTLQRLRELTAHERAARRPLRASKRAARAAAAAAAAAAAPDRPDDAPARTLHTLLQRRSRTQRTALGFVLLCVLLAVACLASGGASEPPTLPLPLPSPLAAADELPSTTTTTAATRTTTTTTSPTTTTTTTTLAAADAALLHDLNALFDETGGGGGGDDDAPAAASGGLQRRALGDFCNNAGDCGGSACLGNRCCQSASPGCSPLICTSTIASFSSPHCYVYTKSEPSGMCRPTSAGGQAGECADAAHCDEVFNQATAIFSPCPDSECERGVAKDVPAIAGACLTNAFTTTLQLTWYCFAASTPGEGTCAPLGHAICNAAAECALPAMGTQAECLVAGASAWDGDTNTSRTEKNPVTPTATHAKQWDYSPEYDAIAASVCPDTRCVRQDACLAYAMWQMQYTAALTPSSLLAKPTQSSILADWGALRCVTGAYTFDATAYADLAFQGTCPEVACDDYLTGWIGAVCTAYAAPLRACTDDGACVDPDAAPSVCTTTFNARTALHYVGPVNASDQVQEQALRQTELEETEALVRATGSSVEAAGAGGGAKLIGSWGIEPSSTTLANALAAVGKAVYFACNSTACVKAAACPYHETKAAHPASVGAMCIVSAPSLVGPACPPLPCTSVVAGWGGCGNNANGSCVATGQCRRYDNNAAAGMCDARSFCVKDTSLCLTEAGVAPDMTPGGVVYSGGADAACANPARCVPGTPVTENNQLDELYFTNAPSAQCPSVACASQLAGWSADGRHCMRYALDADGYCDAAGRCVTNCTHVVGQHLVPALDGAYCASAECKETCTPGATVPGTAGSRDADSAQFCFTSGAHGTCGECGAFGRCEDDVVFQGAGYNCTSSGDCTASFVCNSGFCCLSSCTDQCQVCDAGVCMNNAGAYCETLTSPPGGGVDACSGLCDASGATTTCVAPPDWLACPNGYDAFNCTGARRCWSGACLDDAAAGTNCSIDDQSLPAPYAPLPTNTQYDLGDCVSREFGCNGHGNCMDGSCACDFGWQTTSGVGTCLDYSCAQVQDCYAGLTPPRGLCVGPNLCMCRDGYAPPACEPKCSSLLNDCSGHGVCVHGFLCRCDVGYYGPDCSLTGGTLGLSCGADGDCDAGDSCWLPWGYSLDTGVGYGVCCNSACAENDTLQSSGCWSCLTGTCASRNNSLCAARGLQRQIDSDGRDQFACGVCTELSDASIACRPALLDESNKLTTLSVLANGDEPYLPACNASDAYNCAGANRQCSRDGICLDACVDAASSPTPTPPPSSSSSSGSAVSSTSAAAIAVSVVLVVILGFMLAFLAIWMTRRRRLQQSSAPDGASAAASHHHYHSGGGGGGGGASTAPVPRLAVTSRSPRGARSPPRSPRAATRSPRATHRSRRSSRRLSMTPTASDNVYGTIVLQEPAAAASYGDTPGVAGYSQSPGLAGVYSAKAGGGAAATPAATAAAPEPAALYGNLQLRDPSDHSLAPMDAPDAAASYGQSPGLIGVYDAAADAAPPRAHTYGQLELRAAAASGASLPPAASAALELGDPGDRRSRAMRISKAVTWTQMQLEETAAPAAAAPAAVYATTPLLTHAAASNNARHYDTSVKQYLSLSKISLPLLTPDGAKTALMGDATADADEVAVATADWRSISDRAALKSEVAAVRDAMDDIVQQLAALRQAMTNKADRASVAALSASVGALERAHAARLLHQQMLARFDAATPVHHFYHTVRVMLEQVLVSAAACAGGFVASTRAKSAADRPVAAFNFLGRCLSYLPVVGAVGLAIGAVAAAGARLLGAAAAARQRVIVRRIAALIGVDAADDVATRVAATFVERWHTMLDELPRETPLPQAALQALLKKRPRNKRGRALCARCTDAQNPPAFVLAEVVCACAVYALERRCANDDAYAHAKSVAQKHVYAPDELAAALVDDIDAALADHERLAGAGDDDVGAWLSDVIATTAIPLDADCEDFGTPEQMLFKKT